MARTQRRYVYPAAPAVAAPEALPPFESEGKKLGATQALTAISQLATNVKKKLPAPKRKAFRS
jgi:hypothetical protein